VLGTLYNQLNDRSRELAGRRGPARRWYLQISPLSSGDYLMAVEATDVWTVFKFYVPATLALATVESGADWLLPQLVLAHVFFPISVFVPMAWNNRADSSDVSKVSMWCLAGLVLLYLAAYTATRYSLPDATAAVLIGGSVHLLLLRYMWRMDSSVAGARYGLAVFGGCTAMALGIVLAIPAFSAFSLSLLAYGILGLIAVTRVERVLEVRARRRAA
jgi:hypothetical protein